MFYIMSATYFMGISIIIIPLCHITGLSTFPKHLILWKVVAKKLKKKLIKVITVKQFKGHGWNLPCGQHNIISVCPLQNLPALVEGFSKSSQMSLYNFSYV